MEKLVIDRTIWVRGEQNGDGSYSVSGLINPEKNMCCLGFYARMLGYKLDRVFDGAGALELELAYPSEVPIYLRGTKEAHRRLLEPSGWTTRFAKPEVWERALAAINDYEYIDEDTRESWLIVGFKEILEIELSFEGERIREAPPRSGD